MSHVLLKVDKCRQVFQVEVLEALQIELSPISWFGSLELEQGLLKQVDLLPIASFSIGPRSNRSIAVTSTSRRNRVLDGG